MREHNHTSHVDGLRFEPTTPSEVRRQRIWALGRVQRELKVIGTIGPTLTSNEFELLQTAVAAVADLEAALCDNGIRRVVA